MRLRRLPRVLLPRAVCLLVLLSPPLALVLWGGAALLERVDDLLTRAAPVASSELTRYLQRPVRIGGISPTLSVRGLWSMVRDPETYGKLPVTVTDISVGNRDQETKAAGRPDLATARRVTLFVSLPQVLSARFSEAVARILVEGADVVVVRDRNGRLNLANILPSPPPTAKPSPPFRTVVEVTDSRARFRDYAAKFAPDRLPAVNAVLVPHGLADLTGSRALRFTAEARAQPGTSTVARLGGMVNVTGSVARGKPGDLPASPSPTAPRLLVSLQAGDADAAYWYHYFTAPHKAFRLEAGRVDASVVLTAPQTPPGRPLPLGIGLDARFRGGRVTTPYIRSPLEGAAGTLRFAGNTLQIDAGGRVFGERVAVSGALWDLAGAPGAAAPATPRFAVTLNVPRLPVARLMPSVLPAGSRLPAGLRIGGSPTVQATVVGALSGSLADLSVLGAVAGLDASYSGYPAARALRAGVALTGGLLRVTDVSGRLGDRGRVSGEATVRLDGPPGQRGNAVFDVRAEDVDLAAIAALRGLSRNPDGRLRLSGRGDVAAVGRRVGGKLTAAANVSARQLRVGAVPFPVARARVLVDQDRIAVPAARLESPAGVATVDGEVASGGRLALRFGVSSLDLLSIGQALGIDGLGGIVSASGTVAGTVRDPRVTVSDLLGLNLRLRTPNSDGATARNYALDVLSSDGFDLTRHRLTLTSPLVLRRFPAVAVVTGEVRGITPPGPPGRFDPSFDVVASVTNLDLAEIERQLSATAPAPAARSVARDPGTRGQFALGAEIAPWNRGRVLVRQGSPTVIPPAEDLPPVSGSITNALVRATGTLSAPRITGRAQVGNLLLGRYPADGGSVAFDYSRERTLLRDVQLRATIGTATASAVIRADGAIEGAFRTSTLDVERLSFLADGLFSLDGDVTVAGTFGGTVRRPVVTADVTAPTFTLSGTTYTDVAARGVRYVGGAEGAGVVTVPTFSLRREDTEFNVKDASYALKQGNVSANVTVKNGDVSVLLDTVRRTGLSQQNASVAKALAQLPEPIQARFDVTRLAIRGRVANGRFENPRITADLTAREIRVDTFTANELTVKGSLRGNLITVDEFVATRPDVTIRGQGTYDPDGNVNAYLESNNASLDILRSIPSLAGFPLRGNVDFSVAALGPSRRPKITASVSGRDILVVTGGDPAVAVDAQARGGAAPRPQGILLSLVRAGGGIEQDEEGRYHVLVDDFLVSRGAASVSGTADLPFSFDPNDSTVGNRPVTIRLDVPRIDLATFSDLLKAPAVVPPNPEALNNAERFAATTARGREAIQEAASSEIGGSLQASIAVGGTLRQPILSGGLTITDGRFRLARLPGSDRDRINPINDLNVSLRLAGSSVNFDKFQVTLGGLNGQRGDFGTLNVGGSVQVAALDALLRGLSRQQPEQGQRRGGRRVPFDGTCDLTATFKDFRVVEDNLFNGNELIRTKVNGALRVTGSLQAPRITTPAGEPLRLADSELRPPSLEERASRAAEAPPIRPFFDMGLRIVDRATVTNVSFYRFDVQGDVTVKGDLFNIGEAEPTSASQTSSGQQVITGLGLNVLAEFDTVGGYVQFPTVRFRVLKNGIVRLKYGGVNPGVSVQEVVAKGKITTARGTSLAAYDRGGWSYASSLPDSSLSSTPSQTYEITLTLNGPLDLLNDQEGQPAATPSNSAAFDLSSDPPLQESQILALMLGQSQVDLARQGQVQTAMRSFASQAILSSYVPGFLAPITGSLASSLGLEDITIDYNPDAPLRVRVVKRLPNPMERFTVEITRTFDTRPQPTQAFPYLFNLSYEVYQFKTKKVQPRITAGISTDDQKTVTYLLRGSITY